MTFDGLPVNAHDIDHRSRVLISPNDYGTLPVSATVEMHLTLIFNSYLTGKSILVVEICEIIALQKL